MQEVAKDFVECIQNNVFTSEPGTIRVTDDFETGTQLIVFLPTNHLIAFERNHERF